jgi:hypothetical protein
MGIRRWMEKRSGELLNHLGRRLQRRSSSPDSGSYSLIPTSPPAYSSRGRSRGRGSSNSSQSRGSASGSSRVSYHTSASDSSHRSGCNSIHCSVRGSRNGSSRGSTRGSPGSRARSIPASSLVYSGSEIRRRIRIANANNVQYDVRRNAFLIQGEYFADIEDAAVYKVISCFPSLGFISLF